MLDQVESACKDGVPGVLVTLGAGAKKFSTGFDLKFWLESFDNIKESIFELQQVLARLLTFRLPTLCVMNGHAFAGGYLLSLVHD